MADSTRLTRRFEEAPTHRIVAHLDLDCFYCQVEMARLGIRKDQPFAVQQWGGLLAVNYVSYAYLFHPLDHFSHNAARFARSTGCAGLRGATAGRRPSISGREGRCAGEDDDVLSCQITALWWGYGPAPPLSG